MKIQNFLSVKWSKIQTLTLSAYCMPKKKANESKFEHVKCVQACYSHAKVHFVSPLVVAEKPLVKVLS